MIRILFIMGSMNVGGAETFIMKIFREIDKNKFMFDFLLNVNDETYYEKEIVDLGGMIFRQEPKSKKPFKNFIETYTIVKKFKYNVVFKCSEHSLSALDFLASLFGGARMRIIRSTNTNLDNGKMSKFLHFSFRPILNALTNVKIAPSIQAGEWLFGQRQIKKNKVLIINNALPLELYKFSFESRQKMRSDLGLSEKFIIGHVGRFNEQKNHRFLLDVFSRVYRNNPNSVLLLIGIGELESIIRDRACILGIENSVVFLGLRNDIPQLLMAMDLFLFPSLHEGLPNAVIEAEATGLCCIISDTISSSVVINMNVYTLSIYSKIEEWVNLILSIDYKNFNRIDGMKNLKLKNYDINKVTGIFQDLFIQSERSNTH